MALKSFRMPACQGRFAGGKARREAPKTRVSKTKDLVRFGKVSENDSGNLSMKGADLVLTARSHNDPK